MTSIVMLSAIIHLTLIASFASAKMYTIPEGWNVVNNGSLPQFQGSQISGSYRLVSAFPTNSSSQEFVLSDNGTFGLAFLNFNGTGSYYLSVIMGRNIVKNFSSVAPVWTGNRRKSVSENAVLTNARGQLQLLDSNSTDLAWSASEQRIASIGMEETGNFLLYNESGEMVWQSFDHPTNVLLPGQRFVTGQSWISNANASTMSEGLFTLVIEPSGVVLYLSMPSKHRQPYFLWSITGALLTSALKVCPGYRTVVSYTAAGAVSMAYESNPTVGTSPRGPPCSTPLTVDLAAGNAPRYLQLESDGNLISYKLKETGSWEVEFQLTQYLTSKTCLPLACGSYGICGNGGQCKCLDHGANNITSDSTKCSEPTWPSLTNCNTRYETDFVTITGGAYFSNDYSSPNRVSSSLDDCLNTCRANCSCSALFYEETRRNCYFVQDVLGSLRMDQSSNNVAAFLKFQNHSRLVALKEPSPKSNKKLIVGSISGVGTTAVVIACSLLLLWFCSRKRRLEDAEINRLLTTLQGPHRFSYKRLSAATKGFSTHLGSGGFGSVYEGMLHDGQRLAVKRLHSSNQGQKQFIAEVASLGTISHMNIVRLCGFCAEPSHRLLVYEFMPNGSLDRWIFNSDPPLEWSLRFNIAVGTARGLAYLHEESRDPIIHLDIKPQNILLDENFVAKVGDFGMAKLLMSREISEVVTGVRGTPGYLAPEWLLQSTATKKCDVYSYGMVLLELLGGRKNLDPTKLDSNLSWFFPAWAVKETREGHMMHVVDPRIRENVENVEAERMIKVAFWCIQENPAARPSMDAVVQMLEGHQEISEPPLTFQFAVQAPGVISITASSEVTALGYSEP